MREEKAKENARNVNELENKHFKYDNELEIEESEKTDKNDEHDDDFVHKATDRLLKVSTQNRLNLENLARESIRYGVSVQATASLGTAVLIDVGIITPEYSTKIIDKDKIQRARNLVMEKLKEEGLNYLESHKVRCFFFDGQKDDTKAILVNDDGEEFPGIIKENHYSVVEEPGGLYLTHLTPDGERGQYLADGLLGWLTECSQLNNCEVIGADSTAVNTGLKNGAIHLTEVGLGRKVVWDICLLHINELPLRHLIEDIDGPTSSYHTFSGPIGKYIEHNIEDIDINYIFKKIDVWDDVLN